ncbi:RDD family protein [Streptomyces sp. NPDC006551]|uniref:RDD family protein n=1 Tax=Streptomyces sp. NPDC006551 TaxID=3157178 RepID=UPI0033B68F0C
MATPPGAGGEVPQAGYYPDPSIPGYIRYWNGGAWVPGTSRPAPKEGEALPAPPVAVMPAGPSPAPNSAPAPVPEQVPAVEETGPVFLDEDPEVDTRPEPEPSSAWQADASRQTGFGGDRDQKVSWGAPDQGQDADRGPEPSTPAAGRDPRVAAASPARLGGMPVTPATAADPTGGALPGVRQTPPADRQRPPADGTMTIRAVPPQADRAGRGGQPPQGARAEAGAQASQGPNDPQGLLSPQGPQGAPGPRTPYGPHAEQSPQAQKAAQAQRAEASPAPQGGQASPVSRSQHGSQAQHSAQAPQGPQTPQALHSPQTSQTPHAPQGGAPVSPTPHGPQAPHAPRESHAPLPGQAQPAPAPVTTGPGGGAPSWAQQVHQLAQPTGGQAESEQPVLPWKPPVEDPFLQAARAQAAARPAGLGKRLAARLIDTVVFGALSGAVSFPFVVKALDHIDAKIEAAKQSGVTVQVWLLDGTTSLYFGIALAALLVLGLLYEALPTAKWGRTLGKKLCGLQVRDIEAHEPPTFGAAVRRWLVYSLLGLLAVGVLNVLWCLVDRPWRQCWHDKAARTFVAG